VIEAKIMGIWSVGAWRCGLSRQAVAAEFESSKALGVWQYVSPARQSGSW